MTVFLIPSAVAGLRFAFPPPPFALLNVCYTAALMLKPDAGPHCSHFTPPRAGTPHTGRRCDVSDHGQHTRLRQTIRSAEDDCLLQEAARESERSSVLEISECVCLFLSEGVKFVYLRGSRMNDDLGISWYRRAPYVTENEVRACHERDQPSDLSPDVAPA